MIPIFQQKKKPTEFLSLALTVKTVAISEAKIQDSMKFVNGRVIITTVGQALARSNTGIGTPPFLSPIFGLSTMLQIDHTLLSTTKIENNEHAIRGTTSTSVPEKLLSMLS
jgi:hypothetical protein